MCSGCSCLTGSLRVNAAIKTDGKTKKVSVMAQTGKWVVKNAKMGVWRFQDNRCELFYNYSFGPLP